MREFFNEIWGKPVDSRSEYSFRRDQDKKDSKGYTYWVNVASLSGLLHDLGHGPFSHAFEDIVKPVKHDKHMTLAIIKNSLMNHEEITRTKGAQVPSEDLFRLLQDVFNIFNLVYNDRKEIMQSYTHADDRKAVLIISRLLSGAFDVDKLDYLMRDRVHIGFGYNAVDFDWLLKNIHFYFDEKSNEDSYIYFEEDACTALDEFIFSRISLYWKCIYHRRVRLFELMLIKLLTFLMEEERYKVIFKAPEFSSCLTFFDTCNQMKGDHERGENIGVDAFLRLDDSVVLEIIKNIRTLCERSWEGVELQKVEKILLSALTLPFVDSKSTYHCLYEVYSEKDKVTDDSRELIRQKVFSHYAIPQESNLFPYFFFGDQPQLKGHITKEKQDIKIKKKQLPMGEIKDDDKYFDLLEKSQISQLFSGNGQLVHRYYILDNSDGKKLLNSVKQDILKIRKD